MLLKIVIIATCAYLAFTFLTRPRKLSSGEQYEVEEDVFVDYEEVTDEGK